MAEPIVTNDRHTGLKQSQHHPLAGQSQYNTQQEQTLPTTATVDESNDPTAIERHIQACVIPGKQEEVTRLLHVLHTATAPAPPLTPPCNKELVTIGQLKSILKETLQQHARPSLASRPSYATVAWQHTV